MSNAENLKPLNTLSKAEAKKIQVAGGIARGAQRRQKKLLKDTITEFLETINPETGKNYQVDIVYAMFKKALDGDVTAFNALRDTSGQKPKEDVQVVNMPIINIKGL